MAFTFFFRDRHTLEQLTSSLIPLTAGQPAIRVWDAGCAMGPEPYTFAIILAEALGRFSFRKVGITASDIDETSNFKEIVEAGIYHKSELSRMPDNILENYFERCDEKDNYRIIDLIRNSVSFFQHDLLTLKPIDTGFHAVICKNVLLHLQPQERVDVIRMFHDVLVPGGLLTTEQTQQMPPECSQLFKKIVTDANIFQKI